MKSKGDIITTIDFNKQLYLMMSQNKEEVEEGDDNICLITNMPLNNNFINLTCGHKFNYRSIFNEIQKQKCSHNHLEVTRLKKNEIKCPYCRTIQKGLLPYCDGFLKIKGVNHPEKLQFLPNECKYKFASGKKKGKHCLKKCSNEYCKNHQRIMGKREQKKIIKSKKTKNIKDPMLIVIDDMINKVQNYNYIPKQEKAEGIPTCSYIYKRGKKKGTQCTCKKITDPKNGLCKTHWKQVSKQKNKDLIVSNQNIIISI
jgi:hypothetical protein